KVILAGDDLKMIPGVTTSFLSLQKMIRYLGPNRNSGHDTTHSGVTFSVKVAVSDDRCRVKGKLIQDVRDLVRVTKATLLDAKTGKDLEIEVPNIRKSSLTTSIVVQNGQPLVMPVAYPSTSAKKQDRLWVLFAAPTIWIEEEQELIRK